MSRAVQNIFTDETMCELGQDPETKQGFWIMDREDRRYSAQSFEMILPPTLTNERLSDI